jgi:hypothetical protein
VSFVMRTQRGYLVAGNGGEYISLWQGREPRYKKRGLFGLFDILFDLL